MHDFKEAVRKAVTSSPYCKCIIANIKTEALYASQDDSGEMIYSYQKTEQSFQVFIKSDGHNKTYSVKGYDKDGNPFEKILIRKKLILNMQIFRSSQLFVCILNIQNKPLNF